MRTSVLYGLDERTTGPTNRRLPSERTQDDDATGAGRRSGDATDRFGPRKDPADRLTGDQLMTCAQGSYIGFWAGSPGNACRDGLTKATPPKRMISSARTPLSDGRER